MNFTDIHPKVIVKKGEYIYEKNGKKLSKRDLKRIRSLRVPIVYETLWLSKDLKSDIQVVALDTKGKKQYFYSTTWVERRTDEKFLRMYKFLVKLPILRLKVQKDMRMKEFRKEKTIAYMIHIMELTNMRIGNKKYFDQNESFGLTTLQKCHVSIKGSNIAFVFKGKHGVQQEIMIKDRKVSNFIKRMLELPNDWVMKYTPDDKNYYRVDAQDVNNYIHDAIGDDFTCKDFRTHGANITFLNILKESPIPENFKQMKRNVSKAMTKTAEIMGHNKSTSKKSYIMDYIVEEYYKDPYYVKEKPLIEILKKKCA